MTTDHEAIRLAEALVGRYEALADVLVDQDDAETARLLVDTAVQVLTDWLREHESPLEGLAHALESLSALVGSLRPSDQVQAWSLVLSYVTARSRAAFLTVTGDSA